MEEIIGLFKSSATSLSSFTHVSNGTATKASSPTVPRSMMSSTLVALPTEIITHILTFLPPASLAKVSRTCHLLRSHADNDLLWANIVHDIVYDNHHFDLPLPARTWKELYISHHPYWFLVRHKIWFSDISNTGQLILVRYNHRRGCIEGHRLVAEHGAHTFESWKRDPEVIIHTFNPTVSLWTEDPIVQLNFLGCDHGIRLQKEIEMQTGSMHGVCSMISLCQPIPDHLQDPSMALWPPDNIPSIERVRNESPNNFRTQTHRPHSLEIMSEHTFRIRKWLEFSNLLQPHTSVRMGEEVATFSTLLKESYMPTKDKPYQGIWVGDYSGHGCEFLLVIQRKTVSNLRLSRQSSTGSLPPGMTFAEMEAESQEERIASIARASEGEIEGEPSTSWDHITGRPLGTLDRTLETPRLSRSASMDAPFRTLDESVQGPPAEYVPSGRLEAIKLTGDINVPRGEYTWIAEDIGPKGLLRVADEQMFTGARMVKSWGRVAGRGFRHNRFIPSQLIMISYDTLAQYWEDFGHISFYRRVNIDDFLTV